MNNVISSIFSEVVTLPQFFIVMVAAIILGVLTSLVFSYKSKSSTGFAITLSILPMAIALVIMLVNGNIGAGVAVAGAFALVRFRSVPGTAREIAAIFTTVAIGLALGMGYVGVAAIFFVLVAVFVIVLTVIKSGKNTEDCKTLKISVPENYDYDGLFDELLNQYTSSFKLKKVRTTNMGTLFELTYEINLKNGNATKTFIDELRKKNGNLPISIFDEEVNPNAL